MDIVDLIGNKIKSEASHNPKKALKYITSSLKLQGIKLDIAPNKNLPKSLNYLNKTYNNLINESLINENEGVFVNLFTPTEILHTYGLKIMTVEGIAAFLSGFKCGEYFIDAAEVNGISSTLCSYHKAFIGAVERNIIPKPKFALTTSMICDANIPSFSYVAEQYDIPLYVIDIPYNYSEDGLAYVIEQLNECISFTEECVKKKFDINKLKEIILLEKKSNEYKRRFFNELSRKNFPNTLTLEMFKVLNTYMYCGTEESFKINKMMYEDIKNMSEIKGKRLLWIHMLPFYHETLKDIFNCSTKYQLITNDFNLPYEYELDENKPIESLAKKMLLNPYNRPFEEKIKNILQYVDLLNIDGVINFCHWGCKQSSGGIQLLRDELRENKIPFISIDGDCVDRRNTQDGQIRTRLEAFFEMMEDDYDSLCL